MHYIIETKDQLDQLDKLTLGTGAFIEIINLSDLYHPVLSKPCLVYYKSRDAENKGYIICVNHSEAMNISWDDVKTFLDTKTHYSCTTNIKNFEYAGIKDVSSHMRCIRKQNPSEYNTKTHDVFFRTKAHHAALNSIIPIAKHYEKWEYFYHKMHQVMFDWYDTPVSPLIDIEKNGIGIDRAKFDKYYEPTHAPHNIVGNKAYTYYDLGTSTGRPSNTFNGINFAALPKGKAREAFVPLNDKFIEFDFDGYHVRLLAEMCNCGVFGFDESVHTTLGRLYFDKKELTEEEYSKSKQITFQQLYGGIKKEYIHHPFFGAVQDYINMHSLTHKELNYKLQQTETEKNLQKIARIQRYFDDAKFKSKLVLYTYDSFLFDVDDYEEEEVISSVEYMLSAKYINHPLYPVKIKHGPNYGALIKY